MINICLARQSRIYSEQQQKPRMFVQTKLHCPSLRRASVTSLSHLSLSTHTHLHTHAYICSNEKCEALYNKGITLHAANSTVQLIKLKHSLCTEENEEAHLPCNSFIRNIRLYASQIINGDDYSLIIAVLSL